MVEMTTRTKTAAALSKEEDFTTGKRRTTTAGRSEVDREAEVDRRRGGDNTSDRIAYYHHRIYPIASTDFILYIPIFAP